MVLDTSGALLEDIRSSVGNNVYTFPPNSLVVNRSVLDSSTTERAEYLVAADSLDLTKKQFEIADPDLIFNWSRNEPTITRFDYDGYSNRWSPMPGTMPRAVGKLSNDTRLIIPVPNPAKASSAPFSLYLDETPRVSFMLVFIGSGTFTDPTLLPAFTVEVNSSGELNFSATDVVVNKDKLVSFTGQSFVSRTQFKGDIGVLPDISTASYRIFMNPRPASGQIPRVRIGYGPYLTAQEIALEALLTPPPSGIVRWSADTGRLEFATVDIAAHAGETIYYDGVLLGSQQLSRYPLTVAAGWPGVSFNIPAAVGLTDMRRFVVFAEKPGKARTYFSPQILFQSSAGGMTNPPSAGWYYIDSDTGNFFLCASDVANFAGWTFGYVDALLQIGAPGVGVQMRRSGANGPGVASVPDFTVTYEVTQMLSDNLDSFPFLMLPTAPIVDSYLKFQVQMGAGKFVGQLVDSADPTKTGLGYLLDLDLKRMKYTTRAVSTMTLQRALSSIKLEGAALSGRGVQIKKNGSLLSPSDFDLDVSAGLVEFVEPVGEGDVNSRDVSGTASGNAFTALVSSFLGSDAGKKLLVSSGNNAGIYDIASVVSGFQITVSPAFLASEAAVASVRATDEVLADRIWTVVTSVPKKFSMSRSSTGPAGTFVPVAFSDYVVKQNVGQVSIARPASPGESIKINYVSLDSTDEGVTTTPTQRTEFALFKVGQEAVTFTVGSKILTFNPTKKTVNLGRPMVLYIEGVTQDPASYSFVAPGMITLKDAVIAGPVTIDYWIEEAIGGETTIDLLHTPIDYDGLKVTGPVPGQSDGQIAMNVSGNQTGTLKPFCALLIDDRDMLYVAASSYDAASDLTQVTFNQPVVADGTSIKVTGIVNSFGANSLFYVPSSFAYLVTETNATEIFVSGTNTARVHGDVTSTYRAGTVMDFDGDPYWVQGTSYDAASGITTVTVTGSARRNYITPIVKRSIRPVFNPASDFSTSRQAYISRGFTLAKMGLTKSAVLQQGIDYDLGDDGIVQLKVQVAYGDTLRAMYVARVPQSIGTAFEFNFSHEIAPDDSNGLVGQKFQAVYNLRAPDTFFYRVETVVTMLPEAKEVSTSSSSSTSSGPNTASLPSQPTKDAGIPSPMYDSVHYGNLDVVVQRFLKYYHDLIETYEDIFSHIDGRIVGGSSKRFRYDGKLGRVVQDYSQILNDIDDSAILYYAITMKPFPPFPPGIIKTPVYGKMSDPNVLSRIFQTAKIGTAFIGDVSAAANGDQVGSFNTSNMISVGTTTTSLANAFFTSSVAIPGGIQFTLDAAAAAPDLTKVLTGGTTTSGTNGDSDTSTPPFLTGQKVQVFDLDGILTSSGVVGTINSATPHILPVIGASTTLKVGSVVQTPGDFSSGGDANQQNLYIPGTDYTVALDSGQIGYFELPGMFPISNNPLKGNETVQAYIVYSNVNLAPKRFPALDGKEIDDSGHLLIPRKRLPCELRYYLQELAYSLGFAKYSGAGLTLTDVVVAGVLVPGDQIQFMDGPNVGFATTVATVSGGSITVTVAPPNPDVGSNFVVGQLSNFTSLLSAEIATLNQEIADLNAAIGMFGTVKQTGSGTAVATDTWSDPSSNFAGTEGMLLQVTGGASSGLYRIMSAATHSVIVDISKYPPLIVGPGSYAIVVPWTFLNEAEFQFVAGFYRTTSAFLQSTSAWAAFPSVTGALARTTAVEQRQSDLNAVIGDSGSLTNLLRNGDNLYDTRFMWIDQRTNKQNGLVQLQARAYLQGMETLSKVTTDQRKAFMMQQLTIALA